MPHSTAAACTGRDHGDLHLFFDDPGLARHPPAPQGEPTGLFLDPRFRSPPAFRQAADSAVRRAQQLVGAIEAAEAKQELRMVVKYFDQLSDTLCQVMDVAELVRQSHPDCEWKATAEEIYSSMLEYMNGLNTHVGLYKKIVAVLEDREISSSLSAVEHSVALSFRRDFEKSGIHLTKDVHSRFVVLSSEINNWSNEFLRPARKHSHHTGVPCRPHTSPSYITVPLDSLRGLAPAVLSAMLQQYHHRHRVQRNPALQGQQVIKLPVNDFTAHYILRDCTEDSVREQVYRLFRGGSDYRVQALEEVLRRRRQLARLVGYRSFAAMALHDKMLRKPEHVDGFLRTLAHQVRPNWQRLVHQMRSEKRALVLRQPRGGDSDEATSLTPLWGWDQDYLMARLTAGARDVLPDLSPYFSLGRVMSGLSRLLTHLYGIELRPVAPRPGELWHPEIRKLEVVDADGGSRLLGIIYCDVFARPGKTNVGAAHFTVRCSRRVDDDLAFPELDPETAGSNETIFADRSSGKVFQLPLVVLTCDFSPPTPRSPCLLSPGEVKTLFHEMGHAMHSMLGQTGYHNVAGTRCPVDFVELPSILMEHFALTPPVLQLFASHHQTNQPLQPGLVTQHKRLQSQVGTMDVHSQLFMSALDQKYHSEDLGLGDDSTCRLEREFDWSTKVLADMQNSPDFGGGDRLTFPHVEGTRWQTRFGHLIGYGASYYSYLFDRVLAGKIWQSMFSPEIRHKAGGPLSREGGERFKTEVLRWGGGRDPWVSLAALLDHSDAGLSPRQVELLGRGGQAAVEIVGSWGLYGRDLP